MTGEDSPGKIEAGGEQATEGEVSGHGGRLSCGSFGRTTSADGVEREPKTRPQTSQLRRGCGPLVKPPQWSGGDRNQVWVGGV